VPGHRECNVYLNVEDDAVDPTPTMAPEEPLVHAVSHKSIQAWEARITSLQLASLQSCACMVLTPIEEVDMEGTRSTLACFTSPTIDAPWTDAAAFERLFQANHDTWCPCTDDAAAGQDTSEKTAGFASRVVLDVTDMTATMRRRQKRESLHEERCCATVADPYTHLSPVSTPRTAPPMDNAVAPDEQLAVGSTDVRGPLRRRAQVAFQLTEPMLGKPKRKHLPRCLASKKRARGGVHRYAWSLFAVAASGEPLLGGGGRMRTTQLHPMLTSHGQATFQVRSSGER
jgi:hypothetical protein